MSAEKKSCVLVAVDFSDISDEALRQADAYATSHSLKLAVVHVIPDVQDLNPLFPQFNAKSELGFTELSGQVAALLETRVKEVTGRQSSAFECFIEVGLPHAGVIRCAEKLEPVKLFAGSVGKTGLKRALLGSAAEKIVRYAHCPVLLVRASAGKGGVVVAATDMSDASLVATRLAYAEAKRRNAKLVVVHAIDFGGAAFFGEVGSFFSGSIPAGAVEGLTAGAKTALDAALQTIEVQAEGVILNGSAPSVVTEYAEKCGAELIVVGTSGRTGLARVALGSIAESIIRHAPCSVLAVRA